MSKRLSTAQILAAARGADGDKGAQPAPSTTEPTYGQPPTRQPKNVEGTSNDTSETDRPVKEASETEGVASDFPPSVASLLGSVREQAEPRAPSGKNPLDRPPGVKDLIDQVRSETTGRSASTSREVPADPSRPPSIATFLNAVRESTPGEASQGRSPQVVPQESVAKEKSSDRPERPAKARMSTAEILAAARKGGGAGGGGKSAASPSSPTSGSGTGASRTAAILAAARKQDGVSATQEPKPPATEKKSDSSVGASKTASILAAARKQGGGSGAKASESLKKPGPATGASKTASILAAARKQGGGGAPPVSARGAGDSARRDPGKRTPTAKKSLGVTREIGHSDSADGLPRPAKISEILASIRCVPEEQSALSELPSLERMVAALREVQPGKLGMSVVEEESASDWKSRLRQWWKSRESTHRGASI